MPGSRLAPAPSTLAKMRRLLMSALIWVGCTPLNTTTAAPDDANPAMTPPVGTRTSDADGRPASPEQRVDAGKAPADVAGTAVDAGGAPLDATGAQSGPGAGADGGVTWEVVSRVGGTWGNNHSFAPRLASYGRYLVFGSMASNLVPADTNGKWDVFRFDLQTKELVRASVASDGSEGNKDADPEAVISANGRLVAFNSLATNLVAGDANNGEDVFLRDIETGTTALVSTDASGKHASGESHVSAISDDGRYVVFDSNSPGLVAGQMGRDAYRKDTVTGELVVVSRGLTAVDPERNVYYEWASGHADVVAFETNEGPADSAYYVYDIAGDRTARVARVGAKVGVGRASLSSDGRFLAYSSSVDPDTDVAGNSRVYLYEVASGRRTVVSRTADGKPEDGSSSHPALSSDGRYLAFQSYSSNVAPPKPSIWGIIMLDRSSGEMVRVAGSAEGFETIDLSSDARSIAVTSSATDLVPGDPGTSTDVFVGSLAGIPGLK
jgi:Tol biopolymer transport system component